jgi:WD40 repeat protein
MGGAIAAIAPVVAVAALGGFAPGCKKDHESLILVDLHAMDTNGAMVTTVQVTVGSVASPIFDLPQGGLPMAPVVEYGVYVPAGVTGMQPITAVAKPTTGCQGYKGIGMATVNAGGTVLVGITMTAQDVCGGGSCGTTVGTKPATVTPPNLMTCPEFDTQAGVTCDPLGTTNNPWINGVAVSPDGTLLATVSDDADHNGKVKIWRLQGNTPTPCGSDITGPTVAPGYIAFSPDGQLFAVAWNNAFVDIFKVPSFQLMAEAQSSVNNPLYGVGFSADSQFVLSVDWDGTSDGFLHADRPDGTAVSSAMLGVDPDAMAVSPVAVGGGTAIIVPGFNGNFGYYTWNGTSFSAPVIIPTVTGLAGTRAGFSPNGMLAAESTEDGAVRFWSLPITATSVPTGTNIMLSDVPLSIAFSPGNDFVAFAYNTSFDIWGVASRALVSRHNVAGGTFADSATFSASGGALIGGEDRCGKFLVCSNN